MAKYVSLEFEISHGNKFFLCEFESESPQRNLLMKVISEFYSLDTCDLRTEHWGLYQKITNAMRTHAEQYWEIINKEVSHV